MSEHPILKNIKKIDTLPAAGKQVDTTVETIYTNTVQDGVLRKYDPNAFIQRMKIDPFRVDGFAQVLFNPTLTSVTLKNDRHFTLTSNLMPSFYRHVSSLWQVSYSPIFDTVLKEESSDEDYLTSHTFNFDKLPFETYFYFRVKYFTNISYTGWSNVLSVRTRDLLPLAPPVLSGEIHDLRNFSLKTSPYAHPDFPHTKTKWVVSLNADFENPFYSITSDTLLEENNAELSEDLVCGHMYYARAKFFNDLIESSYSTTLNMKLDAIAKPIVTTVVLDTVSTFKVECSPYTHTKIDHTHSEWELCEDILFAGEKISTKSSTELLSAIMTMNSEILLDDDVTYYFRVRHWSDSAFSEWSDTKVLNIVNISKPTIDLVEVTNNETVHLKTSAFIHTLLPHKKTTYHISDNELFEPLLKEIETTGSLTELFIMLDNELEVNKDYFMRVRYHSDKVESDWSDTAILNIVIPAPVLDPMTLTDEYNFSLISSAFVHPYLIHNKTEWLLSYLQNFSSNIISTEASANLITNIIDVGSPLKPNTTYYAKNKYKCGYLSSDYSNTVSFKTPVLNVPTITEQSFNAETKQFTLTSSVFMYMDLEHTQSVWEISKSPIFEPVLENKTILTPSDMTHISFDVIDDLGDTDYYFRVKQITGIFETEWSDIIKMTTPTAGGIETPSITVPDLLCPYNFHLEATAFEGTGTITQTKSVWQICENNLFADGDPTLKTITIDTNSVQAFNAILVDSTLVEEGKQYFIRVKYLSEPTP